MLRQNQATVEARVASAHRHVIVAAGLAESWRDQGHSDDLRAIALELERLQNDLLRGRSRRRAPTS